MTGSGSIGGVGATGSSAATVAGDGVESAVDECELSAWPTLDGGLAVAAGGAISGDFIPDTAGVSDVVGDGTGSGAFGVTPALASRCAVGVAVTKPAVASRPGVAGELALAGIAGGTGAGLGGAEATSVATGWGASAPVFPFGGAFRDFPDAVPAGFDAALGAGALLSPAPWALAGVLAGLSLTGFPPVWTGSMPVPGFGAAATGLEGVFESLLMGLILLS
jgi:hypothetical protein